MRCLTVLTGEGGGNNNFKCRKSNSFGFHGAFYILSQKTHNFLMNCCKQDVQMVNLGLRHSSHCYTHPFLICRLTLTNKTGISFARLGCPVLNQVPCHEDVWCPRVGLLILCVHMYIQNVIVLCLRWWYIIYIAILKMNQIEYMCVCVCVCVCARARVCVWEVHLQSSWIHLITLSSNFVEVQW
jgi:hypothetical protein